MVARRAVSSRSLVLLVHIEFRAFRYISRIITLYIIVHRRFVREVLNQEDVMK
jgi:uncharacterized membrane protein YcjF (UPF0283 family)